MRLDIYLFENGFAESRSRAQELIRNGAVEVDGKTVIKPSCAVSDENQILCRPDSVCRYVSRGGLKLEAALDLFRLDPDGKICADIGASTGGFTDCLLQRGARRIYAVDSGTAQLHPSLRQNNRVISLENCNARYLTFADLGETVSLVVMDVSFISQIKLYPAVCGILEDGGYFVSLIKPQFEVGKSGIGKGGIVQNDKIRQKAVSDVCASAATYGFNCLGTMLSPITGGDGNVEYLAVFRFQKKEKETSL